MNNINYNNELKKLIDNNVKYGQKPKLLLHSCCAPCSSTCLERLVQGFEVIVYFYNPNLDSESEFNLRASEQQRLCDIFGVKCIVEKFNKEPFFSAVKGYEKEKEGGERCFRCFNLRLENSAKIGEQLNCEYFATTLTLSPLKNSNKINEIGFEIEKNFKIKYLPTDFKKDGGYLKSIELSKKYNLYRQNYCGCGFSKKERELQNIIKSN